MALTTDQNMSLVPCRMFTAYTKLSHYTLSLSVPIVPVMECIGLYCLIYCLTPSVVLQYYLKLPYKAAGIYQEGERALM